MTDYDLDSDSNGIPDAFEHRRSISDILNDDQPRETVTVEIEVVPRRPCKGELFLCASRISKAEYDYSNRWPIVKIVSGNYEDLERMNESLDDQDWRNGPGSS